MFQSEIQTGKYKSESLSRRDTNRNEQIEQIQIKKYKYGKTNRTNHMEKTSRNIQLGKYNPENTNRKYRKIHIDKYK